MPNDLMVPGNYSQAHQRRYLRLLDQHGRRWGVNIEIKNGAPTGPWDTFFHVPHRSLIPSQRYLKRNEDRPNRVWIDYDAIIRDIRQEQKEYDKEVERQMRKRYREGNWRDRPIDVDILNMVGVRPGPVEVWVACKQGNRYALGLTTNIDERVLKFLPQVEQNIEFEELDFSESDGGAPVEREPEPVTDAWDINSPDPLRSDLDDLFDAEALGGTTVDPRSTKAKATAKGKKPKAQKPKRDVKADLMDTE
jgi:hypothetical protein